MKSQLKFYQTVPAVALFTGIILLVPFVAMQFTNEVNWSVSDFIIMGALLFGTGILFMLVTRLTQHIVYKVALGLAVGAAFFMIYVNLAVGLIGDGPHWGNLMYASVVLVLIVGVYLSRFKAAKLERAMYATAGTFVLLAVVALAANMQEYPGSSVVEIISINLFFALPFAVSSLLFRYAAMEQSNESDKASV
ncbi:MAG: hypothetical protein KF687_11265 [Cyclobacteriaceae bacterium]|nr:hypothetical protein [Cyclobacteriaceae bacterium]